MTNMIYSTCNKTYKKRMEESFKGKTISKIDVSASNVVKFKFTDGTECSLWSEISNLPLFILEPCHEAVKDVKDMNDPANWEVGDEFISCGGYSFDGSRVVLEKKPCCDSIVYECSLVGYHPGVLKRVWNFSASDLKFSKKRDGLGENCDWNSWSYF